MDWVMGGRAREPSSTTVGGVEEGATVVWARRRVRGGEAIASGEETLGPAAAGIVPLFCTVQWGFDPESAGITAWAGAAREPQDERTLCTRTPWALLNGT